jgi:glycosyltransferase involved in cell wall biosynthesis
MDVQPAVSVIVPARDAAATLQRTLDGLQRQQLDAAFEVIVVDNGSLDDTAAIAEQHPIAQRVIRRTRGEGAGAARNDGVGASRAPILAFIDSDCEPSPTWLAEGTKAIEGADIVAGAVTPPPDEVPGRFDRTLWVTREHGLYETANLFVRREWFERLGGFQDWIPEAPGESTAATRPFGEDVWFAWRARRMGARTVFGGRSIVYHALMPGTARDYIVETWRLRHFPTLVARIPELRKVFAWQRVFLSKRSAAFDAAAVGAISSAAAGSAYPLVALVPYAVMLLRELRTWGARRALATAARDAVGSAALVLGSVQARKILL